MTGPTTTRPAERPTDREDFDAEVADAVRYERGLWKKALLVVVLVALLIIARQLYFL
jgi:hypothetical protein